MSAEAKLRIWLHFRTRAQVTFCAMVAVAGPALGEWGSASAVWLLAALFIWDACTTAKAVGS